VVGGGHGGGVRPSDGGGACSISAWGGRRRLTGLSGPKGRVGQLAARPIGPEGEKNPFGIKLRFLNLPGLWKFVHGDLERILSCQTKMRKSFS
jgi:hypothetical protein